MVMGFALCASVAFAQTNRISIKDNAPLREKAPAATKAAVDYKASIFTKANGHDTIQVFKIDVASDYTIANVTASDRINDTLVGSANAHNVAGDKCKWMRVSSCADFLANGGTIAPQLANWMGVSRFSWITEDIDPEQSPREPEDDGFMFLSYFETSQSSGVYNTYFTVPSVQRPANAQMIEVSLTQSYRKYYDRCYIDYKAGGKWWAREINVTGIDISVNAWGANKVRYVLPHKLNSEQTIEIRIRAWSNGRGNVFGYFWAVDNVAVMALTLSEYWALNSPTNIDGFYGMIPQGMEIPLTWGVNAQNLSTSNITNAHATLTAGTDRTSLSQVLQGPNTTVVAGNIDTTYGVIINERGFYNTEVEANNGGQSWINHSDNFENTTGTLVGGFQGRGLPVATTGKNFYNINVAGGSQSRTYDTVLYYVTPNLSFSSGSNREGGYRWGLDNGIIPSGASFQTAFTDDGYVTNQGSDPEEGGHANLAGYAVHARFVTGNDIPEGWVFRGLELIAATDRTADNIEGASIVPVTYKERYEEDEDGSSTLYFNSLSCGIDGMAFEVQENEINDQLYSAGGYILPDAGYKAINIQFIEQPALEPNSSYRFGYRLNDDANFALAGTRSSFRFRNDTGAYVNVGLGYNGEETQYANAAAGSRDYRYVPAPNDGNYLQVIAYDPNAPANVNSPNITAFNIDNYPMIRPIVGPARPVEHALVGAICDDNVEGQGEDVDHAVSVTRGDDDICGTQIQVTAGSQVRFTFEPTTDHTVIDRVLLNGVELPEYNEEEGTDGYMAYEYNVVDETDPENPNTLLERDYWVYYMSGIEANAEYEFTVYSHWAPFNVGIDPVAPDSYITLAPNPATSMVKLNVKGVTGMVNCSILDMSGRVIYNANINAESEHMINVSNIPAGAYFVRVTNDTFSKIEKLIIK